MSHNDKCVCGTGAWKSEEMLAEQSSRAEAGAQDMARQNGTGRFSTATAPD